MGGTDYLTGVICEKQNNVYRVRVYKVRVYRVRVYRVRDYRVRFIFYCRAHLIHNGDSSRTS